MRVLFDTNVVLDVLLAREPHVHVAAQLLSLVDRKAIEGALCATTVTTIHYLAERSVGGVVARRHVEELLTIFDVADVDGQVLRRALDLGFDDYEDAVLHEAARLAKVDAIVTRNAKDFAKASLPVLDPPRLLAAILATA
jgi:predicted nucleic acid-binding protein